MRKIILFINVSLDGYFEGPNRELDWSVPGDELLSHFNEELAPMGAFLYGRVVYELLGEYWSTVDTSPENTGPEADYARIWTNTPKIVFSKTLERAKWNSTIKREVVVDDINALKAQPGGDLSIGGSDLAATFMQLDLIDEYRVYVHPVLIGRGNAMFKPSDTKINLKLDETRTFGNGVVLLRYQRQ